MKGIDKLGVKLWALIMTGHSVTFAGKTIDLEHTGQGPARAHPPSYHWLHYSTTQGTTSHGHTDQGALAERFHTEYYTAKQGYPPDLSTNSH